MKLNQEIIRAWLLVGNIAIMKENYRQVQYHSDNLGKNRSLGMQMSAKQNKTTVLTNKKGLKKHCKDE